MSFWQSIKNWFDPSKPDSVPLYCVPQSISCAWTWGALRKVPVRIAVYNISKGKDHSQAECLIDDKWTPLTLLWDNGPVVVAGVRHYPDLMPYRFLSLREWVDEQIQFTEIKP